MKPELDTGALDAPGEMKALLETLGALWARSPSRPRVEKMVSDRWDHLIETWVASDLPLVVRKGGGIRGAELVHTTGRRLIVADNSPAQWAFSRALEGDVYEIETVRALLERDEIPFAYATKTAEKAKTRYKRTLAARDNVNRRGWKLCHIRDIGLSTRAPLETLALDVLEHHFRSFLAPSNQFLVPLRWGGLGEVPEFIEALRLADLGAATA